MTNSAIPPKKITDGLTTVQKLALSKTMVHSSKHRPLTVEERAVFDETYLLERTLANGLSPKNSM